MRLAFLFAAAALCATKRPVAWVEPQTTNVVKAVSGCKPAKTPARQTDKDRRIPTAASLRSLQGQINRANVSEDVRSLLKALAIVDTPSLSGGEVRELVEEDVLENSPFRPQQEEYPVGFDASARVGIIYFKQCFQVLSSNPQDLKDLQYQ